MHQLTMFFILTRLPPHAAPSLTFMPIITPKSYAIGLLILWSSIWILKRRQDISNDVYLASFLASWLSDFVLPRSSNSNEVRLSTFEVASKMARGSIFSLAVPVFAYLYQCFNKVAVSSHPEKAVCSLVDSFLFCHPYFFFGFEKKQPSPQSEAPKKKIKKPIILDNPYSLPRQSTLPTLPLRCSSSKSLKSSSVMSLATRPCPDTTIWSSPRRYPQQYLLNILKTRCHHFCGRLIRFKFEDPSAVPSPLEMTFPESFNHPTEGLSYLMPFKTYIDSLFEGEDSIFEGKDAQAVIDKFENGRELLVLGQVKAKSIGTPSHSMSSEYSASVSNYPQEESKNDVIEVEDEDDDLYDYTPLSNCSPKSQSSSHSIMSTTLSGSPKPDSIIFVCSFLFLAINIFCHVLFSFLIFRIASFKVCHISFCHGYFKDHVSSTNLRQAASSNLPPSSAPQVQSPREVSFDDLVDPTELEELIARIEKPPAQSNHISSSEVASHIQRGLLLSLNPLYEKVKTLVKCLALWAKVADTSSGDVSLRELEAQYEEKQAKFEEMTNSYIKMVSSVSKLTKRVSSLEEEITRTKEQLKKLESELSSCKAKQSSSQNDLVKCSESVSNFEKDLQAAIDAVEQRKKKSAHYDAVKEALDATRASLMN
ncbi:hypothetical protein Vadar_000414 [Vaccinium darrowii]|uniref:Uncharacterized protein n=1 Tax=Vaccinium darrowii TaxID=229202 RepID=A0ACB7Z0S4_9ERIC|nr:hypothetical protein Vadar_000414 [Vaccinium darrowii]